MTRRDARAAGRAVSARMNELQLSQRGLAEKASVDAKTLHDLLEGKRWPQHLTRGRIELALGWEYGTLANIAEGLIKAPGAGEEPVSVSPEEAIRADRTLSKAQRELALAMLRTLRGTDSDDGGGGRESDVTDRRRLGT